ncbi:MAG: HEPN domain-containing protein [Methanosarcinales archaeon]
MESKLITLTPDKWGLIEELGNSKALDLDKVKSMVKQYLNMAKMLLDNDLHYQSIISRAYYKLNAVRAAVYIQMRLDVQTHKDLVRKFRKVLIKIYKDDSLGKCMNDWRINRNRCDYNPFVVATRELCEKSIEDAEAILKVCKNLMVV